jgi:DNA-binding NtrC family response regulator
MTGDTILYIYDQAARSDSVLAALDATGYDVVSTNSSNQAMALFLVMHSAAAVVLDLWAREQTTLDFARRLRAIHSRVPIVLRCCEHIDLLPSWVDAYVSPGDPLEKLTAILQRMLDADPAIHDHQLSDCHRCSA